MELDNEEPTGTERLVRAVMLTCAGTFYRGPPKDTGIIIIIIEGFSAEIPVFVLTGDSVKLDIQTKPEFEELTWINTKLESIVKYYSKFKNVNSYPAYNNRAKFNENTFSLILENMQKNDSGLYKARISGEKNDDIVTYRVSVLDAVEAPNLTVNSNSSDFCMVNFTCRAQDLIINSSYQNNQCSPEEATLQEMYTLNLSCSEKSIICNYSNPVSWKIDKIDKQLCVTNNENKSPESPLDLKRLGVIAAIVLIGLLIVIFAVFYYCKHRTGSQDVNGTVYDHVQPDQYAFRPQQQQ
nr:uncharacterized protein LOC110437901 [Danio rerio]|eukprot:XP_021322049.1 uncharacterized protein LOC110437901 [Danio rerio]